jgi:hypothetical protein
MMDSLSSLRAQRGNPDLGAATGSPRRAVYPELRRRAPRNDGRLRAFAAKFILSACKAVEGREPNHFLFSREATKAQRKRSIYGPGSNVVDCAADVLRLLGHNMPPLGA